MPQQYFKQTYQRHKICLTIKKKEMNIKSYNNFSWITCKRKNKRLCLILRCVYRPSYCSVLMTNEMHSSYNQFLFHSFCLLYMFRTNLVDHHQEHGVIYCITQYNRYNHAVSTIVPIVPNCVTQCIMPCSRWWTARFVQASLAASS